MATVAGYNSTVLTDLYNNWVLVGSDEWKLSWPAIQGANAVTATLTAGNTIVINGTSVAVPAATNNTIQGLSTAINTAAITGVYSAVLSNKLCLFANSTATADGSTADDGAVVITSTGSTSGLLTTLGLTADTTYYAPGLQQSPNYTYPRWLATDITPRPTGSVWNKITSQNLGTLMVVQQYSTALGSWVQQAAPVYENDWSANAALDATGGGKNIAAGDTYTQYNVNPAASSVGAYPYNSTYTLQVFERASQGTTIITGSVAVPVFVTSNQFSITTSIPNSTNLTATVTVTINGTDAAAFNTAVSSAGFSNVVASVNSTGAIVLTQTQGGVILLKNVTGTPLTAAGFTTSTTGCRNIVNDDQTAYLQLSGWIPLVYTASAVAPDQDPADGTYWYYSYCTYYPDRWHSVGIRRLMG